MKHFSFYYGAACLLLNTTIAGQNLPGDPTIQQVIGYHQAEHQRWNTMQLPKNSVLFKSENKYAGWQSFQFDLKKEIKKWENLFTPRHYPLYPGEKANLFGFGRPPYPQSPLGQGKPLYLQWQKDSWLKGLLNGQGSLWLREFIIQNKNKNFFHL